MFFFLFVSERKGGGMSPNLARSWSPRSNRHVLIGSQVKSANSDAVKRERVGRTCGNRGDVRNVLPGPYIRRAARRDGRKAAERAKGKVVRVHLRKNQ